MVYPAGTGNRLLNISSMSIAWSPPSQIRWGLTVTVDGKLDIPLCSSNIVHNVVSHSMALKNSFAESAEPVNF